MSVENANWIFWSTACHADKATRDNTSTAQDHLLVDSLNASNFCKQKVVQCSVSQAFSDAPLLFILCCFFSVSVHFVKGCAHSIPLIWNFVLSCPKQFTICCLMITCNLAWQPHQTKLLADLSNALLQDGHSLPKNSTMIDWCITELSTVTVPLFWSTFSLLLQLVACWLQITLFLYQSFHLPLLQIQRFQKDSVGHNCTMSVTSTTLSQTKWFNAIKMKFRWVQDLSQSHQTVLLFVLAVLLPKETLNRESSKLPPKLRGEFLNALWILLWVRGETLPDSGESFERKQKSVTVLSCWTTLPWNSPLIQGRVLNSPLWQGRVSNSPLMLDSPLI